MTDPHEFETTLGDSTAMERDTAQSVCVLTILSHVDPGRVGDRTVLRSGRTELSRLGPQFIAPRGRDSMTIGDRYVSRKPIVFQVGRGGDVRVARPADGMAMTVDGVDVASAVELDTAALESGVLIDLAGRVCLLLHRITPAQTAHPHWGILGENAKIETLREHIARVAALDIGVLIRGESGTGKELVAHAIHQLSGRRSRPWITVNMAALPSTTAASQLFGHLRGAFTGATRDHKGCFEAADGGTLFLDEVAEASPEVQAMLLRVLETGEIQPVGGTSHKRVDVRVLTATDANLEQAADEGRFRFPLLQRLSGFEITVPPLRARRDDIGRLLYHFAALELREQGLDALLTQPRKRPWVPSALMARLAAYDWPGNVRQLRNLVRQMIVHSRDADALEAGPSVQRLLEARPPRPDDAAPDVARVKPAEISEQALIAALRANGWRLMPTARALGIARSTLYLLVDRCQGIRRAGDIEETELRAAFDQSNGAVAAMATTLEVSPQGLKRRLNELGWSAE